MHLSNQFLKILFIITVLTQLTFGNEPELLFQRGEGIIAAAYAPDKPLIAFTTANYIGLYYWNPETQEIIEISTAPAAGFGFQWSPGGNNILYKPTLFIQNRRYDSLVRYDVKTHKQFYIISDRINLPGRPEWVNSEYVLLQGFDGTPLPVRNNPGSLSQSYLQAIGSYVESVDPNTGKREKIIVRDKPILRLAVNTAQPVFAFEEYGGNLYILEQPSGKIIDLGPGNDPVWSPDGKRLAFMRTEDDGHQITASDIFIVASDGTGMMNITDDFSLLAMRPSWSPDGTYIIFDNDGTNLYRVEVR